MSLTHRERAIAALRQMATPSVRVRRDGRALEIPSPELVPGDPRMQDLLQDQQPLQNLFGLVDPGFSAGQALGLRAWPVYAIVDRDGVLQYVDIIEDQLPSASDIGQIMQRVRSGDDVASEMKRDYEQFLERYYQRLESVRLESNQ